MKYYLFTASIFLLLLACNNWDKEKLQPFAVLELSKSEYNLTFGSGNVGGESIDFVDTIITMLATLQDTIIIRNTGSSSLVIDSIISSHPLFFWIEGGRTQTIIPPNTTKQLILTLAPHDYVTEYTGDITIYSNYTGGVKVIPVKASLGCNANLWYCGGNGPIGSCFGLNEWCYSPNTYNCANCIYEKGFDIRIISVDTVSESITIQWQQHNDISYETAILKVSLWDNNGSEYGHPWITISPNVQTFTFDFDINPFETASFHGTLKFDTYKNGVRIIYYSPFFYNIQI